MAARHGPNGCYVSNSWLTLHLIHLQCASIPAPCDPPAVAAVAIWPPGGPMRPCRWPCMPHAPWQCRYAPCTSVQGDRHLPLQPQTYRVEGKHTKPSPPLGVFVIYSFSTDPEANVCVAGMQGEAPPAPSVAILAWHTSTAILVITVDAGPGRPGPPRTVRGAHVRVSGAPSGTQTAALHAACHASRPTRAPHLGCAHLACMLVTKIQLFLDSHGFVRGATFLLGSSDDSQG